MTPETNVGPLEMRVLGLLDGEEPQSVADIQKKLMRAHHEDLAYTTVMTVLGRLHDKGLVDRKKESRRYLYSLARNPKVKEGILDKVRRALFHGDRVQPIVALIEEEDLSEEELRALRRRIDSKLKERRG